MAYPLSRWERNIPITDFPSTVLPLLKEYKPEEFKTREQIQSSRIYKYACEIWDQVSRDRRQAFREQWKGKKTSVTKWYKEEEAANPTVVTRGQDHIPRDIFEQQPIDYYVKYCAKYSDVLPSPVSSDSSAQEEDEKENVDPKPAYVKPSDRPAYNDPVVQKFRAWRARKDAGITAKVSSDEEDVRPIRHRYIDNPPPLRTAAQALKERREEEAQALIEREEMAQALRERRDGAAQALKKRRETVPTPSTVNPGSSISQIRPITRAPAIQASTTTGLQRRQDRAPIIRAQTDISIAATSFRAPPEQTNTSRLHQRYEQEVANPQVGSDLPAIQAAPSLRYAHARDPGVRGFAHATDDSQLPKRWAAIKRFTADQARKSITIRSSENTGSSSEWNTSSVVEGSRLNVALPEHEPVASGPSSTRTLKPSARVPEPKPKAQAPKVETPKARKGKLPARNVSFTKIANDAASDPFISTEKALPFETIGISKHGRLYKYRSRSMETIQADIDNALKGLPNGALGKKPRYRPMPDSPTHKPRRTTIATAAPTTEPNVPQPVFRLDSEASSEASSPAADPSQEPRAVTLRRIVIETKNDPKANIQWITAFYRAICPKRFTTTITSPPIERRDFSAPDPESPDTQAEDSIRDPPRWKYAVSNRDFLAPHTQRRVPESTKQGIPTHTSAATRAPSSRGYVASISDLLLPKSKEGSLANAKHNSNSKPASYRGFVALSAKDRSIKHAPPQGFSSPHTDESILNAAFRWAVPTPPTNTSNTASKHETTTPTDRNSKPVPARIPGYVVHPAEQFSSQSSLKREYVSPIQSEKLHRKASTESLVPFPEYDEAQAILNGISPDANNDNTRRVTTSYGGSTDEVKTEWDRIMHPKLRAIVNAASKEDDTLNMWKDRSNRTSSSRSRSNTPPNRHSQAAGIQITINVTWASLIPLLTMFIFAWISVEILMTSLFGMPVYDDSPHWEPGSPVFPYVLATKALEWCGLAGTSEGDASAWRWYEWFLRDIVPDVVACLDIIILSFFVFLLGNICYRWCRQDRTITRGRGWWEVYGIIF